MTNRMPTKNINQSVFIFLNLILKSIGMGFF